MSTDLFIFAGGDSYRATDTFLAKPNFVTPFYPPRKVQVHELDSKAVQMLVGQVRDELYEVNPVMQNLPREHMGIIIHGLSPKRPEHQVAWNNFLASWERFALEASKHITMVEEWAKHGVPYGRKNDFNGAVHRLRQFRGMIATRRKTLWFNKLLPQEETG